MKSKKKTIGFQGVSGAHADLACRQAHPYLETRSYSSFDQVLKAAETGEVDLCMIPIENTNAGRVAEIHDLLPRTRLYIVGEYFQRVEHFLAAPRGATLDTITDVYSHPQALMQCRQNLEKLGVNRHAHSNTAVAAKDVASWNDKTKAVLCSYLATELYGLEVLRANMEDVKNNYTVFLTMSLDPIDPDFRNGRVITSLFFGVRNIPSALYKALGGFATNNVNLHKLESYIPGGRSDKAQFFASFEGHPDQRHVQLAIEELGFFCKKVKVLGVYPADPKRFEEGLI